MVTIGMNYKVLPGKEEVFERAFEKVIAALRAAPGHSESHLYREVGAERDYLIVSEWNDKTAFDQFMGSDEFRRVVTWGKEQILAGPPRHRMFNQ